MQKIVTERDFRKEEFRNANPDDYEFRDDGEIVRKDRWEVGMRRLAAFMGKNSFEVSDIVDEIRQNLTPQNVDEKFMQSTHCDREIIVIDSTNGYLVTGGFVSPYKFMSKVDGLIDLREEVEKYKVFRRIY